MMCPQSQKSSITVAYPVCESLLVWLLPCGQLALGDPPRSYFPRQHSSQGRSIPFHQDKVVILRRVIIKCSLRFRVLKLEFSAFMLNVLKFKKMQCFCIYIYQSVMCYSSVFSVLFFSNGSTMGSS